MSAGDQCGMSAHAPTDRLKPVLRHPFELRDPAGGDPLGHEDVADRREAGVVRMHELPVEPLVRLAAEIVGCPVDDYIEKALLREAEKTLSMTRRADEPSAEIDDSAANQ